MIPLIYDYADIACRMNRVAPPAPVAAEPVKATSGRTADEVLVEVRRRLETCRAQQADFDRYRTAVAGMNSQWGDL